MGAQANSLGGAGGETTGERRTALRYHFAKLMTNRQFDAAMAEALVAHSRGEILEADLQFVAEIVRGAERKRAREEASLIEKPSTRDALLSSPWAPAPVSGTA